MDPAFVVRPLAAADIPQAHALSAGLGWPHRQEDWRFLHDVGEGVAACDAGGHIVGTAMWFPFGADVATVGMIIVSPTVQRRGLGRRLMEAIDAAVGDRELRLNATAEGYRLYEALGYVPIGTIIQHQGVAKPGPAPRDIDPACIRTARSDDWVALVALDAAAHGAPRDNLFDALHGSATAMVCEHDGKAVGFAACRRAGHGHVIGPVIAESEAMAIALAERHLRGLEQQFVRLDVPLEADRFRDYLEGAGLVAAGRVTSMARPRRSRRMARERIFGLVSQALG